MQEWLNKGVASLTPYRLTVGYGTDAVTLTVKEWYDNEIGKWNPALVSEAQAKLDAFLAEHPGLAAAEGRA